MGATKGGKAEMGNSPCGGVPVSFYVSKVVSHTLDVFYALHLVALCVLLGTSSDDAKNTPSCRDQQMILVIPSMLHHALAIFGFLYRVCRTAPSTTTSPARAGVPVPAVAVDVQSVPPQHASVPASVCVAVAEPANFESKPPKLPTVTPAGRALHSPERCQRDYGTTPSSSTGTSTSGTNSRHTATSVAAPGSTFALCLRLVREIARAPNGVLILVRWMLLFACLIVAATLASDSSRVLCPAASLWRCAIAFPLAVACGFAIAVIAIAVEFAARSRPTRPADRPMDSQPSAERV